MGLDHLTRPEPLDVRPTVPKFAQHLVGVLAEHRRRAIYTRPVMRVLERSHLHCDRSADARRGRRSADRPTPRPSFAPVTPERGAPEDTPPTPPRCASA